MATPKVTAPTPWQERALAVPERYNLALLGGRGSGKTTALALIVLRHCVQYEDKARVLILRATYKSLANLWDELEALFSAAFPGGVQSNRADFVIRCPNGAVVTLGNLSTQKDVAKWQGQEANLLAVDEITNFTTLRHINMLRANLRGPAGVPTRMIILGNPGGPLHATIARMHVHGRVPWKPYTLDDGSEWVYAPSTFIDNPTIDQDRYARSIIASAGGDRALSEAWLNNNWNDLAGAFFGDVWGDHLILPTSSWRVPSGSLREHGWYSCVALDWAGPHLRSRFWPSAHGGRGSLARLAASIRRIAGLSWTRCTVPERTILPWVRDGRRRCWRRRFWPHASATTSGRTAWETMRAGFRTIPCWSSSGSMASTCRSRRRTAFPAGPSSSRS